jgi:hypothetical protein
MTPGRKVDPPSEELGKLLLGLGREPLPRERSPEDEQARAELMAERIDAALARMVRARRATRRTYTALALAAAIPLVVGALALLRDGSASLTIQRESPTPMGGLNEPKVPQLAAPPAPPAIPSTVMPRPARERDKLSPRAVEVVPRAEDASTPAVEPAVPDSTLGQENQLFREAAEAARAGDVDRALARLDQLVLEYPTSPLTQTAIVRRFRLLAKAGRAQDARREAARYLEQYPTGFAVNEARDLVAGSKNMENAAPDGGAP